MKNENQGIKLFRQYKESVEDLHRIELRFRKPIEINAAEKLYKEASEKVAEAEVELVEWIRAAEIS